MIEYIREMNKNYMRITEENIASVIPYGMRMVESNDIDGLLKVKSNTVNGRVNWLYEISGKISLEEKYANKSFSAMDLDYIIEFLRNLIKTADKYMLDMDSFIMLPEAIFCDIGTGKWYVPYCACISSPIRDSLKILFEFILKKLEHKEQKAVVIGYGLYKRMCQEELDIEELFETVEEEEFNCQSDDSVEYNVEKKSYPDVMPETFMEEKEVDFSHFKKIFLAVSGIAVVAIGLILCINIIPLLLAWRMENTVKLVINVLVIILLAVIGGISFKVWLREDESFTFITSDEVNVEYAKENTRVGMVKTDIAETDISDDNISKEAVSKGNENQARLNSSYMTINNIAENNVISEEKSYELNNLTVVLSPSPVTKLVMKSKADIPVNEIREYAILEDVVTIGSSQADLIINEPEISRIHARISREGEMLFIKDMNSTNGTWVNEHKLEVYEVCPVRHKDIIKLADIKFELIDTLG